MTVGSGSEHSSGNFALIETLRRWGITFYSGVNGGGVIHVAKQLEPFTDLSQATDGIPRFLTMGEYVSGFVPVGYYLASGRIAGSITTTGAATKLGASGITEAKLHNIPAVYIIALNSTLSIGLAPLQDVSEYGMNVVPQLQAELGDGCVVIDNINKLEGQLRRAQQVLNESRPVAFAFHPDVLSKSVELDGPKVELARQVHIGDLEQFLEKFPRMATKRRVIIYVGEEAARCEGVQTLTTQLSELLQAPTVWSVNGANAVSPENRYGYGYILFGGNDRAFDLWKSINQDDILITLGFDPGEYSINLGKIPARFVWHFTNLKEPYGHKNGDFKHRVAGEYQQVRGDIALALSELLPRLRAVGLGERPRVEIPGDLNTREVSREVKPGCVDFVAFYEQIQKCWRRWAAYSCSVVARTARSRFTNRSSHALTRWATTPCCGRAWRSHRAFPRSPTPRRRAAIAAPRPGETGRRSPRHGFALAAIR